VIILDAVTGAAAWVRAVATRPQVWVALGAVLAAGGLLALIFALVGAGKGPLPLGLGDHPVTQVTPGPAGSPAADPAESGRPALPPGAPSPTGAAGPGSAGGSAAGPAGPPGGIVPDGIVPGGIVPGGVGPVYNAAPTPQPADPPDEAAPPPAPPARVPLTARYTAAETEGLLGYRATVTITNPGRASHGGWALVIKLPATALTVSDVSGATVSRAGTTWTFTPTPDTLTVPAGESVLVRYLVRDAPLLSGAPRSCAIDGAPCAGLG
jgi:hypothetical protein